MTVMVRHPHGQAVADGQPPSHAHERGDEPHGHRHKVTGKRVEEDVTIITFSDTIYFTDDPDTEEYVLKTWEATYQRDASD